MKDLSGPEAADRRPGSPPVLEPEVLDSLDAAGAGQDAGVPRPGCAMSGSGCGCLGMPLAVVAGVVVSSLLALGWILRAGRVLTALLPGLRRRGSPSERGPRGS